VASRIAAKITGEDEFGTIESGKRADLLLVRSNPLADVANLKDPIGVMAAGRWYPRARLREIIYFRP
jgi:imidazolonepropionase-like amidohydrolase